jgi:hypothetical protein
VDIEKDGQFVDSMEIWCCPDFEQRDYENVGFLCRHCIDRFAKRFKNKPVSDRVLEQLGIIPHIDANDSEPNRSVQQ